ncbi:MAG: hypothetical protein QOF51_2088 [Chloroflexota bacterium]|nr:hypothetical protein [Chloroflexota bacterium]
MQQIVISWQIYNLTDSALSVGLVGLFRAIPVIAFSLIGGTLADAMDRRRLLLITQVSTLLLALTLATLTTTGLITEWLIYGIAFLASTASSFDQPARQAIIPTILPPQYINNAVNVNLITRHTGAIIGPTIGGFVIDWYGVPEAYWVVVALDVVQIGTIVAMRIPPLPGGEKRQGAGVRAIIEGMRFAWATPIVLVVLSEDFVNTFFGNTRSAYPTFARDVFLAGPEGLGILAAAPSVGALLGIAGALYVGDVRRKGLGMILCSLGFGLSIIVFGLGPTIWISALGLAGYGFVDAIADSMNYTLMITETPNELQGRVASLAFMMFAAGPSLGQLQVGFLISVVGPRQALTFGGSMIMLVALMLLIFARPLVRYGKVPKPAAG